MALGAMDSARLKHGLKIPEQVSIVGFDGFGAGRWLSYQLTTLRQPIHAMAAAAVEMLFQRIENPDLGPERRLFSAEIVCGQSARLGPSEDE
jgi:DNA-binding LacI/PurR family transcriptional regulator